MAKKAAPSGHASPTSRTPLTLAKKILFAAVATGLFFVGMECALAVLGLGTLPVAEDPYVEFDGSNPLYVSGRSDSDQVGSRLVTSPAKLAWFNEQSFTPNKPQGTFRVFCLGGSTTYGRPYSDTTSFAGWMRAFLMEGAGPDVEVINAGGISYASYRVTQVLQEVLQYDPDLVVIYTGHNEFLEDRTFREVRDASPLLKNTDALLSRTRSYGILKSIMKPNVAPTSARHLLPAEVKTRLDSGIGPNAFQRDDAHARKVEEQFEVNLRRMIDLANAAGCRVLLVAPASNLRDCSPFKNEFSGHLNEQQTTALMQLLTEMRNSLAKQEFELVLQQADEALSIDPRCSAANYHRGLSLYELQRFEEARSAFVHAKDEDVCTLRATTNLHQSVLRIAKEKIIPVVDFQAFVEGQSEHGIPGDDLFLDHVHPTVEAHKQLALQIIDQLQEHDLLPNVVFNDSIIDRVTGRVMSQMDPETHGDALRNLAKVFRWAGKKDEADKMALRASELLQNDANVLYLAANALLEQGEINEALSKLQVAAKSNPKHAPTWISLGVAEKRLGHVALAAGHFQHALELDQHSLMALNNLAAIHIEQQRWQMAEELLKQAIAVDARYAKAHRNLAAVYAKQAKLSLAIESLSTAVSLVPEDYQSHLSLGQMLQSQKRTKEAVVHFRLAIQLNSKLVQEANTLAWILATSNDDTIRDGNEALKLAIGCAKQTQYKNPAVFNTLAAAYAEVGDFNNAINWQKKALAAAPAALKQACQNRLELYQQERPFRSSQ